jgi:hypothetical protein
MKGCQISFLYCLELPIFKFAAFFSTPRDCHSPMCITSAETELKYLQAKGYGVYSMYVNGSCEWAESIMERQLSAI